MDRGKKQKAKPRPQDWSQHAAERRGDELWKFDQGGGAVLALFFRPIKNDFPVPAPSLP
jgi:hypothetical protein